MIKKIDSLIEEAYITHNDWEDDEMYWMKEALVHALDPLERKIYLTYLENGTYTATAKAFKVTSPTVASYCKELKNKIINYIDEHMI